MYWAMSIDVLLEEAAGLGAQFRDEVSAGVAWILENPRVLRLRCSKSIGPSPTVTAKNSDAVVTSRL
jgi:hypothetical protein